MILNDIYLFFHLRNNEASPRHRDLQKYCANRCGMAEPAWARSWFRIPTITSKCQTFFGCNTKDEAFKNIVGPYVLLVGVWLFLLYHCGSVLYFAHSTALQSLNGWTLANSYGHPLINIHEALVPGIGKGDTSFSWLDPKPLKKIPTTNVFGDEPYKILVHSQVANPALLIANFHAAAGPLWRPQVN